MVLRLSLYSLQFFWWYSDYPYTHHSDSSCWSSVYPYPHHILFGGTQTKPIRIIVSLVVLGISPYSPQSTWWLRQSLYSSQSPSWYPDYPFTHHSLPQRISIHFTVSLGVLRIPLCSSLFPWWYSDYPYTHHSLPNDTQTIPLLITVSQVVVRLSFYTSQSPWLHSDCPFSHDSFPGGTQTIPTHTTVSL